MGDAQLPYGAIVGRVTGWLLSAGAAAPYVPLCQDAT